MSSPRSKKLRVLITAGPTREYIDSVRFLSNGSSGRMGYACAATAFRRGHQVTLISGPVDLPCPEGVTRIQVISAAQMAEAVLKAYAYCDAVIMTAAVADYRPVRTLTHKFIKSPGPLAIQLERTTDILAELGWRKKHQILIGFAVQDKAPRQNARRKLKQKNLDAIILNHPSALGSTHNTIEILRPGSTWEICPRQTKLQLARRIVVLAETMASKR